MLFRVFYRCGTWMTSTGAVMVVMGVRSTLGRRLELCPHLPMGMAVIKRVVQRPSDRQRAKGADEQ